MAQPAEVVVNIVIDTRDARRKVRQLRNVVRETDIALARLEAGLDTQLAALADDLRAFGIRLEVEA